MDEWIDWLIDRQKDIIEGEKKLGLETEREREKKKREKYIGTYRFYTDRLERQMVLKITIL